MRACERIIASNSRLLADISTTHFYCCSFSTYPESGEAILNHRNPRSMKEWMALKLIKKCGLDQNATELVQAFLSQGIDTHEVRFFGDRKDGFSFEFSGAPDLPINFEPESLCQCIESFGCALEEITMIPVRNGFPLFMRIKLFVTYSGVSHE